MLKDLPRIVSERWLHNHGKCIRWRFSLKKRSFTCSCFALISDISQLLQLWRTSANLTCKSWLLCSHSNKNCHLRFPSVYVLCSHVKEGSAVEEIGFSRSNRISALLIALQPDLAQAVLVLVNSSKAAPQWLNLHGLKSVTCSGLLSTVSICFTCCFFFPFVISSLIYLLLPPDT